jgi:hypothetical protein
MDTPVPTATPQPTPTPTPTMDADPTVYDNFNNPANDGGYNQGLWLPWYKSPNRAEQQNGVMVFTHKTLLDEDSTSLAVRRPEDWTFEQLKFFEARLMLSSETKAIRGNVQLGMHAWLDPVYWWAQCRISRNGEQAFVKCTISGWNEATKEELYEYGIQSIPTSYDQWHEVRIEVDQSTFAFTFYIDGQQMSSHVPSNIAELRQATFHISVGVWDPHGSPIKGYVDDVRIGPAQ